MEPYENLREFVRINTIIPFEIAGVFSENDNIEFQTEIIGEIHSYFTDYPPANTTDLSQKLDEINTKLDSMLNLLLLQQKGFSNLPQREVNLSAGGLGFISERPYIKGDILQIKMMLSIENIVIGVNVFGKVIRCDKINGSYDIGVKFINITDKQKDLIVRFVLYRERQLRKKKLIDS